MDDIQSQMQQEIDKKDDLESKNRLLQQELHSLKSVERAYQKLEKAKRKLDEEFSQYKVGLVVEKLVTCSCSNSFNSRLEQTTSSAHFSSKFFRWENI
jgi:vacuolar-type H+-ATPase subunit I/STV1